MRLTDIKMFSGDDLKIRGVMDDNINFVAESQLKNRERWEKLVEPFITKEDSDGFWRGEFFGKEMRGAALSYMRYSPRRWKKYLPLRTKKAEYRLIARLLSLTVGICGAGNTF